VTSTKAYNRAFREAEQANRENGTAMVPLIDLDASVSHEGGWIVLRIPKALVVLTRAQFIEALKRGKRLRRQQVMEARVAKADGEAQAGRVTAGGGEKMPRGKSQRSLAVIETCYGILEEIQPASVRAVCYRLFTCGQLESMEKTCTNRVSTQLVYAREHRSRERLEALGSTVLRRVERVVTSMNSITYKCGPFHSGCHPRIYGDGEILT